jgi:methylphosphotriester-DNA--protein-cysteine methyltransferase
MSSDYKQFGESIFNYFNNRGWNSMTKKEMVTILVHYGIENNLLEDTSVNKLSVKLKINPSGVRRILEERYESTYKMV